MKFLVCLLVLAASATNAQPVLVMDFVKVRNDKYAEALFYYENNWKSARDIALKKGVIKSYRLEKVTEDSATAFDLVLITEYKDSIQYGRSEENFRKIISAYRPGGAKLLMT